MNNDEYDYGHNVPRYHMDGEGDLEEIIYKETIYMKVRIRKTRSDAVIPSYAKPGDAGMDLTAVSEEHDAYGNIVYHTGLAFEIPEGYVGLIFPRSSNAKQDLSLTNAVGVIDSGYRGEVTLKYRPRLFFIPIWNIIKSSFGAKHGIYHLIDGKTYDVGDRVGQIIIMPYPKIEFEEVDELSETERGTGSYGSSGR